MLALCAYSPLLFFASLAVAEGQNEPNRTIQECIEAASYQQNPPETVFAWMNHFKYQGWSVKYGGKGWLKTPQNVSVPYEIPTEEGCVPQIIDRFLRCQCKKECQLDWESLHRRSECGEMQQRDIRDKITSLIENGTMPTDFGHMLSKEIRSNIFGDNPAKLYVEDCALSKLSVVFSKDVKSEGNVFNVTTMGSNDTTIFILRGKGDVPVICTCNIFPPEKELHCAPIFLVSNNRSNSDVGLVQYIILVGIPVLIVSILLAVCVWLALRKPQGTINEKHGDTDENTGCLYRRSRDDIFLTMIGESETHGTSIPLLDNLGRVIQEPGAGTTAHKELVNAMRAGGGEAIAKPVIETILKMSNDVLSLDLSEESKINLYVNIIELYSRIRLLIVGRHIIRMEILAQLAIEEEWRETIKDPLTIASEVSGGSKDHKRPRLVGEHLRLPLNTAIEAENRLRNINHYIRKAIQKETMTVACKIAERKYGIIGFISFGMDPIISSTSYILLSRFSQLDYEMNICENDAIIAACDYGEDTTGRNRRTIFNGETNFISTLRQRELRSTVQ